MLELETPSIEEVAKRIAEATGGFTGGPVERFGEVGQQTLKALKRAGLSRYSYVLDVGCGALRLGYWLIRYLQPDRYCGLEPVPKYVEAGLQHAIGPELAAIKRPRFDHNSQFDFSSFGVKFDFVVARSIFSHASPEMIGRVLDSFRDNSSDDATLLVSYNRLLSTERGKRIVDVKKHGEWSWRRYGKPYLQDLAKERGLRAGHFGKPFSGQVWLHVTKRRSSSD